ncbi:MAG TPA: hypothetical protein VIX84_01125 [Acidimicrobiales bacterium]
MPVRDRRRAVPCQRGRPYLAGSPTSSELSFLGYTAMDVSATALMWRFFAAHPLGY